jgi:hypothetical protein
MNRTGKIPGACPRIPGEHFCYTTTAAKKMEIIAKKAGKKIILCMIFIS